MDHDHSHDHGDMACATSHAMVFHAGVCQEILFNGWMTTTGLEVFYSSIAIFVAGILYEGLKYTRETLLTKGSGDGRSSQVNIAKNECGPNGNCGQTAIVKQSMFSAVHLVQTGCHIIQTTMSYMLMLIFMTYNVWLCIALVLGLTCGYFLFGWKKQTVLDVTEHCQ